MKNISNPCSSVPKTILVVAITASLLACAARDRARIISEAEKSGYGFNWLNIIQYYDGKDSARVITFGKISGDEIRLAREDLVLLTEIPSEWGKLKIAAPFDQDTADLRETIGLNQDFDVDFQKAAGQALSETIQSMPSVDALKPLEIIIIAAPPGTGYSFLHESRTSETPVSLSFMVETELDREDVMHSVSMWWMSLVSSVGHELMHLEHRITKMKLTSIDMEAAGYLMGFCVKARFAQAGNAKYMPLVLSNLAPYFHGIEEGNFYPDLNALRALGQTSLQGRTLSFGLTYHLFADHDEVPDTDMADNAKVLDLSDPEATRPMLEMCNELPNHVPNFSKGETK